MWHYVHQCVVLYFVWHFIPFRLSTECPLKSSGCYLSENFMSKSILCVPETISIPASSPFFFSITVLFNMMFNPMHMKVESKVCIAHWIQHSYNKIFIFDPFDCVRVFWPVSSTWDQTKVRRKHNKMKSYMEQHVKYHMNKRFSSELLFICACPLLFLRNFNIPMHVLLICALWVLSEKKQCFKEQTAAKI